MDLVADSQDVISMHLLALGWISSAEQIQHVTSAGEGNMNHTVRVTLDTRSIVLKQSVPFVAKYPDIAAPIERIAVEAEFYRATKGQAALNRHMPKVLGFDPDNHLLCLEDLGPSLDFSHLYDLNGSAGGADKLPTLISWLSELHNLADLHECLPQGLNNPAMRALNHAHIFEIPLTADNGLTLDPALTPTAEQFVTDDTLVEQAGLLGQIYLGHEPHASPNVLLHGDFYPGSWLEHADHAAMVIDPEFAFLGAPEFDVGVLLGHLTMCHFEQSQLTELLRHYAAPEGFSYPLAEAFAGIEVIRRLLGVAQLPLSATWEKKISWLNSARTKVLASTVVGG